QYGFLRAPGSTRHLGAVSAPERRGPGPPNASAGTPGHLRDVASLPRSPARGRPRPAARPRFRIPLRTPRPPAHGRLAARAAAARPRRLPEPPRDAPPRGARRDRGAGRGLPRDDAAAELEDPPEVVGVPPPLEDAASGDPVDEGRRERLRPARAGEPEELV